MEGILECSPRGKRAIHSHLFQDGKPNTALITEKVGFHLGLLSQKTAVIFWSQSSTELLPSEEQSPSRDGGVVVLVLEFAGEGH